jgi:general secretion pathway protein K
LVIGNSRIVLRLENEAARINPNFASRAILEGLLRATGSDAATAKQLATAIAEWIDTAAAGRSAEEVAADYWEAGLDYRPPGQPMETLDELARVLGMTPAVIAAIRPHLTLYGPQVPDVVAADTVVAAALEFVRQRPGGRRQNVPRGRRGVVTTVRINATAHGPENAEITRTAVIRLNREKPYASAMLAWGPSIE